MIVLDAATVYAAPGVRTDPALLYRDPARRLPAYRLRERFVIDAGRFCGEVYQKWSGGPARRVVVREMAGCPGLFDTDDCHDLSNAVAKLEEWLSGNPVA